MNQTFDRFADDIHIITFLSYNINFEKCLPHAVDLLLCHAKAKTPITYNLLVITYWFL